MLVVLIYRKLAVKSMSMYHFYVFPSGVICLFRSYRNTKIGEIGSNTNNDMIMEWLWKHSEEITGEHLCDLPNNFKFIKDDNNRFP